jgi:hypothetical protein
MLAHMFPQIYSNFMPLKNKISMLIIQNLFQFDVIEKKSK